MKRLLVLALAVTGILAAGCFVRFGTVYQDTNDQTHFVALASNLTNVDVVAASIQVDFFDSSNHFLLTEFVAPCTRTLQHHQDSPIDVVLPVGVTGDHVRNLAVKPITFGTKTVADLDVDNIEIATSSGSTHITGDIDVGNADLFAVQVCAALLDNDGNVVKVGQAFTSPLNIDSDDTGTFDVAMESDSDAEQFELWVDAVTHNPNDVTAPVVVGPDDIAGVEATPTRTATPGPTSTPTITPTP